MRIRATVAKGIHASVEACSICWPRLQRGWYPDTHRLKGNIRVGLLKVEVRRNPPVVQAERGLDQAGNAGRGFQMPDVRLHRPYEARLPGRTPDGQRPMQRVRLHRVTHFGPGAVCLDILYLAWHHTGL